MKPAPNKSDTPMIEPVSREEAFTAAVAAAKRNYPHLVVLQEKRELGDCFALLWSDASGVCTDAGRCGVAKYCRDAHEDALSRQHAVLPRIVVEHPPVLAAAPLAAPSAPSAPSPPAAAPPRRRRSVYSTVERPVDHAVEHFVHELGDPKFLPRGWHPSHLETEHKRRGRAVVSRTPSFLSVLVDGKMVVRIWTNAAGRANVEIVDDLVPMVRKAVGHVERIPEGSQMKSRPCSYRVKLQFADDDVDEVIERLAAAVRKTFHLEENA